MTPAETKYTTTEYNTTEDTTTDYDYGYSTKTEYMTAKYERKEDTTAEYHHDYSPTEETMTKKYTAIQNNKPKSRLTDTIKGNPKNYQANLTAELLVAEDYIYSS